MSGTVNPDHVAVPRATHDLQSRAAGLLDTLLRNPKTARDAAKLVREVNPDAQFPTLDLAESYAAPLRAEIDETRKVAQAATKALEEFQAKQAEKEQVADLTTRLTKAREKYGFDDAKAEEVLKRMRDQNNPDLEAAAAYVYDQTPKPPPTTPRTSDNYLPSKVDLYGSVSRDEQWKKLHDNPQQFFDDEVRAVLNDPALAA